MNLSLYKLSDLEKWITIKYKLEGIRSPYDLQIESVAGIFNIEIQYYSGPSLADWSDLHSVIFLNKSLTVLKMREIFFHELCHPVRHVGYQGINVPQHLEEMQERQARLFQFYAALPMYLIEDYINDSANEDCLELVIAENFQLPVSFVKQRIEQIYSRTFWERRQEHSNLHKKVIKLPPDHAKNVIAQIVKDRLLKEEREKEGYYAENHN